MKEYIIFERKAARSGELAVINLNRPEALNALNYAMIQEIAQHLETWAADKNIGAVLFKSAGERAFCAGSDLREIFYLHAEHGASKVIDFFMEEYRLNELIASYPKPIISLMHGITMGGGVGLATHAKYRIACEDLIWAMPETAIGFFPDIGSSYFFNQMPGALGMYLALTGRRLHIADALYAGVIDYYISSNHYAQVEAELLTLNLAHMPHHAITHCLASFSINEQESILAQQRMMIDDAFSVDNIKDILRILSYEDSEWAKATLLHLQQKCPLSLVMTHQLLLATPGLALKECLKYETSVMRFMVNGPNLYEGIRAVLLDKTMDPRWTPSTLDEVDEQALQAILESA